MDCRAGYSDCFLEGFAPAKKLTLLLRSLLAISSGRKISTDAFDYWYKCEKLRLEDGQISKEGRYAAMDKTLTPGFMYSPCKLPENMSLTMLERADSFFGGRFAKINDGALILVGDMDEEEVLKILSAYITEFSVDSAVTPRTSTVYRLSSGESTFRGTAESGLVDVVFTCPLQIAAENRAAAFVAAEVLKAELSRRFSSRGIWVDVEPYFTMAPKERLDLRVVAGDSSLKDEIISCVRDLSAAVMAPEDFNPSKDFATSRYTAVTSYPPYWMSTICSRLADGKDFNTKFADKFAGVTPEKVRSIMELLYNNGKAEYIVTEQ